MKAASSTFVIVVVTLAWLIAIPAVFLLLAVGMGWSRTFVLLGFLPVLLVFVPGGYYLAIAGNERYGSGGGHALTPNILGRLFFLGILIAPLSLATIWMYGLFHAHSYLGMLAVGALICLCALAVAVVFRGILREIRKGRKHAAAAQE